MPIDNDTDWDDYFPPSLSDVLYYDHGKFLEFVEDPRHIEYLWMPNETGSTMLHYAAMGNDEWVVSYLISRKIPVHVLSQNGRTPLHLAANYGAYEVAKLLLEAGALTEIADMSGYTPLRHAEICRAGNSAEMVQLIQEYRRKREAGEGNAGSGVT